MFHFHTPLKRQKTSDFLAFSGVIEMEHRLEMVNYKLNQPKNAAMFNTSIERLISHYALSRPNLFKVNNWNTKKRWEIRSKLTVKISQRHHWRRSSAFNVNQHILDLSGVFLLLTLNKYLFTGNIHWTASLKIPIFAINCIF